MLQRKAAGFLAVYRIGKQRSLADGSEIVAFGKGGGILLLDQRKRFFKLQHRGKGVLAFAAAEAGADKVADLAVPVGKFHLVDLASFHQRIALVTVEREIEHAVFPVVVVPTLRRAGIHAHAAQVVQRECGIGIAAADELRVLFRRRRKPEPDLPALRRAAVKGDEVRAAHHKAAVHIRVYPRDDALVVGEIDAEAVVHRCDDAGVFRQLAVDPDAVAGVQVKAVVVVGELHAALREADAHHRLPRCGLRFLRRFHRRTGGFGRMLCGKSNLECHVHHTAFLFFTSLFYSMMCPINRTLEEKIAFFFLSYNLIFPVTHKCDIT